MSLDEAYTSLVDVFGHENVLRRKEEIQPSSLNIQSGAEQKPAFVLKPVSTERLSQLFPIAQKYKLPVTPRGSGFDLAKGSTSSNGILVDLASLNQILEIDEENYTFRVQSGTDFESITKALTPIGLCLGLEPVMSPKATIGGFLASHGIGYGSMQRGSISNLIRDLEVALSDGSKLRTGFKSLSPGGTGYDLTHLLVGSEGLLGIITEATLDIFPKSEIFANIAFIFSDIDVGTRILKEISKSASSLSSMFIMDGSFTETLKTCSIKVPPGDFIGVIRLEGTKEAIDSEAKFTKTICESSLDPQLGDEIWNSRFLYPLIEGMEKPVSVDDYFLPTDKNVEAYHILKDQATKHGVKSAFYSLQTSLDSNLVVFVLASDDLNKADMANRELEDAIISLGGRPCTAGSRRVEAMKKASPNSLDLLRKAKKVFDEANLFSPERLI